MIRHEFSALFAGMKPMLLMKRIMSAVVLNLFMLFFFWGAARLIKDTSVFSNLCIFMSTTYATATILFVGQDRLLFMVIPDCDGRSTESIAYARFIVILSLLYVYLLIVGIILGTRHDYLAEHPVLLGILLAPYINIQRLTCNLYKAFEMPVYSRLINIAYMLFFLIAIAYLASNHADIVLYHYAMLMSLCSFLVSTISMMCIFRIYRFYRQWAVSWSKAFISIDENRIELRRCSMAWLKKGGALFLNQLMDFVMEFAVPILYLFHTPAVAVIAYTIVSYLIKFQYSLSVVMKNHFFAIFVPMMGKGDNDLMSLNSNNFYQRLCHIQWMLMGGMTLLVLVIGPFVLDAYGAHVLGFYPLLFIGSMILFPVYGCILINPVVTKINALQKPYVRYQIVRLLVSIVLMSLLTHFYGVYGMMAGVSIPALVLMFLLVRKIKQTTRLDVCWPRTMVH